MRHIRKAVLPALLLFGAAGCVDLEVQNPNAPEAERALGTAGDVESLIAGTYQQWWNSEWSADALGPLLSIQSFQHSAFPANFGMTLYGALPRTRIENDPAHQFYIQWGNPWSWNYRSISAASDGLRALNEGRVTMTAANERRARAFAKFNLGLAHGSLAILFDQAFIVDETTQVRDAAGAPIRLETRPYTEVLNAALGYLDEAAALAGEGGFALPPTWMSREVSAAELARLARSYKARFRAAAARTPQERQAVNWDAVIADVDAGITADWNMEITGTAPWGQFGAGYYVQMVSFNAAGDPTGLWSQINYQMLGMADQSGRYQRWLAAPIADRQPNLGGVGTDPFIIVTPDLRFPRGATLDEQRQTANRGRYYIAATTTGQHGQPARGTWRWSWYLNARNLNWFRSAATSPAYTWVPLAEMRMLKAEGLYNKGDRAGAAALINVTRTANGLNATDANGTNTSCVPRLPDGSCGGLFEMLKWEKRNEVLGQGLMAAPWYFDSRGWGDLYLGTQLQFPVPCREAQVLEIPCYTFGGVGGESASPGSTYRFPAEM